MFTVKDVTLREFRPDDAKNLNELYNDSRVAPAVITDLVVPRGMASTKALMDAMQGAKSELACIIEKPQDSGPPLFVGMTGLVSRVDRGHRSCDFAIVLSPDHWGKGYGSAITEFVVGYAFQELNMYRVGLEVWEDNERARKLYEKLGFQFEGIKRGLRWRNGKREGLVSMSILVDEWKSAPSRDLPSS